MKLLEKAEFFLDSQTMDQAANGPSLLSDPSPQSLLEPLPASELLKQEIFRKESLHKKGNPKTGCTELDEYVLRGGFERGSVVGLSAEDDEAGMLVSPWAMESFSWPAVDTLTDWPSDDCPYVGLSGKQLITTKGNGDHDVACYCAAPKAADGSDQSAF